MEPDANRIRPRFRSTPEQGTSNESDRGEPKCQPCSRTNKLSVASVYCRTCKQYQCLVCTDCHSFIPSLCNHDVIPADEASLETEVEFDGLDKCSEHEESVRFLCGNHDLLLCNDCVISEHRYCDKLISIKKIATSGTENIDDLELNLKKLEDNANQLLSYFGSVTSSIESQINHNQEEFDTMTVRLLNILKTLKQSNEKKISCIQQDLGDDIDISQGKIETVLRSAQDALCVLDDVEKNGTPVEKYICLHHLRRHGIPELLNVLKDEHAKMYDTVLKMYVRKELSSFLGVDANSVKVELRKPYDYTLQLQISKLFRKSDDDKKRPAFRGLALLPDDRIVLIDKLNFKCFIVNKNFEKQGNGMKFKARPLLVTVLSDTSIAISFLNNEIHLLNVTSKSKLILALILHTSVACYSVSMMNEDTLIYSTLNDIRAVRKINLSGHESDFDNIPFTGKKYQVHECQCTFVRRTKTLVLSDREDSVVYMYNINTENCIVVKDKRLMIPTGVCEGPDASVLVCSSGTNSVVRISSTGQILSVWLMEMATPFVVSAVLDKNLLVLLSWITPENVELYKMVKET